MAFGKAGRSKRKTGVRQPLFENVLIVTDGEETEINYFNGLKSSFPEELRRKIRIKIINKINTQELIDVTLKILREDPTFREAWIIFDRDDREKDFDLIISKAKKNGIFPGWSNPCIEVFFHAYFGKMPNHHTSSQCIADFARDFKKHTNKEYKKNDTNIYGLLSSTGNEAEALEISKNTLQSSIKNAGIKKPSEYCPASSLHLLVAKITKHR